MVREIGLSEAAVSAIEDLDEHWDGGGYPAGKSGEAISTAGRILCLAQTAEVCWQRGGASAACAIARRRRGSWFDPRLVDAKSPYTARHSAGVAELAVALSSLLGLSADARATVRRAALLHDLGKLGVSNQILDKPARLTEREWTVMRAHPRWSREILTRVSAFAELAGVAAAHHERLDGSGYYAGLTASELGPMARILAVADVAEALSADRPYRSALSADEVLELMRRDAGRGLDPDAFSALGQALPAWSPRRD